MIYLIFVMIFNRKIHNMFKILSSSICIRNIGYIVFSFLTDFRCMILIH